MRAAHHQFGDAFGFPAFIMSPCVTCEYLSINHAVYVPNQMGEKEGGIPLCSSPQTRNNTHRAFPKHTLTTIYEVSEPTEIISIVGI